MIHFYRRDFILHISTACKPTVCFCWYEYSSTQLHPFVCVLLLLSAIITYRSSHDPAPMTQKLQNAYYVSNSEKKNGTPIQS